MKGRFALLAALFVVVPILEIYFLIQVGQVIGAWWTVLLLIAGGVAGSLLIKREGRKAWTALSEAVAAHRLPHRELADGALILMGGTLLVTPGFVTDVVGLLLILPLSRPVARRILTGVLAKRITAMPTMPGPAPAGGNQAPRGGTARRPGPDVVQGEVID